MNRPCCRFDRSRCRELIYILDRYMVKKEIRVETAGLRQSVCMLAWVAPKSGLGIAFPGARKVSVRVSLAYLQHSAVPSPIRRIIHAYTGLDMIRRFPWHGIR